MDRRYAFVESVMHNKLYNKLDKKIKDTKIGHLFIDCFDTLVHRRVHPHYTLRIWAKLMIRELGLPMSIDDLFYTRQASTAYLTKKLDRVAFEIPYRQLIAEIYGRLLNANMIQNLDRLAFVAMFEEADVRAELQVQFVNQNVLDIVKEFKTGGGKVYLVSDFYGPRKLFERILKHHAANEFIDGIFVSADLEKSKQSGSIFPEIISQLKLDPNSTLMIGDNNKSDYLNPIKHGLHAYKLPHRKYLIKNKLRNFGSDRKKYSKIVQNIYKSCNGRNSIPYTEYALHYHVFAERLYEICKKNNINELFFLAREGQFLKRLFDNYQEYSCLSRNRRVKTHYLKISRQASMQISTETLDKEGFHYIRKRYVDLSIHDFLTTFNCSEDLLRKIEKELHINCKKVIKNYFDSSEFQSLKKNKTFTSYYNSHRASGRTAFKEYINSFGAKIHEQGMHVVDIGWGGTVQESLFKFFNNEISVTGYYLGLRQIYNLESKTKRFGLNFSVLPYPNYYDQILMANTQLYEQFCAANHGSTLYYDSEKEGYAVEHYEAQEKRLYDCSIQKHQEEMLRVHNVLLRQLAPVCYDQQVVQEQLAKLALKVGLLQGSYKIDYSQTLSKNFYQNIGTTTGISYTPPKIVRPVKSIISFLLTPEKYFRYLVKLKSAVYARSKLASFFMPMRLIYLYYRVNRFVRTHALSRFFPLKYIIL